MRFAWTADQVAFRDAVRELLTKECAPLVVRAAWDAEAGALDRGVWDALDGMGVLSVLVPEPAGGLGLDERSLVPVLEESGRAALPHPIVETAMVAAPLGATGRMVTTTLGGLPPCAADADAAVVADGGRLLLVDDLEVSPLATVDRARRTGALRYSTAGAAVLADDPAEVAAAFDRGVLGTAAQLVGLSRAMLAMTVAYVTERQQFGVPIGSFQAVKHHLADALLAIEFAAPAVARAGDSVAGGSSGSVRGRDVSMAKALAGDAADVTGRAALQCHGAIGYTVEHDLHLFLKRSWALARSWGDRSFHAERVARALGL